MGEFSIYTKEEQFEQLDGIIWKLEDTVGYEDLDNYLEIFLNRLKHNVIKCLEKAFESTIQGKEIEFTTDSKVIIKK